MDASVEKIAIGLPDDGGAKDSQADVIVDKVVAVDAGGAGQDGGDGSSVSVSGTFNTCPALQAAVASPPAAVVGETINVNASAFDKDTTDKLTYAWTATAGSFAMPAAASTTYTCSVLGAQELTIKVSDGQCEDMSTIDVVCTAADAGASN
jgi:hypothetical protein